MKFMAVLVVLFVNSMSFAQKHDPGIRRDSTGQAKGTAYKSLNSDAVAVALKRNTSSSSDLAKIEHRNLAQSHRASHPSAASLPKNTTTGKNKPIRAPYKAAKKPH